MTKTQNCLQCGAPLSGEASISLCVRCLMALSRDEAPTVAVSSASETPGPVRDFGNYELLEQIGRGGMGVVFRARDRRLNRLVALKMIQGLDRSSPVMLARFQIEAEASAKLDHPNIVSTYEVGDCDGTPFFSMRLVHGTHLGEHIARLSADPSRKLPASGQAGVSDGRAAARAAQVHVAQLMAKVAMAVAHAHDRGVVHRDLKPSNILIDEQGQPHLTDFGIAKLLSGQQGLTASTAVLGTPQYMSPEQATGGVVGPAADVYSLGAVLYQLLTGLPPFRATTPLETLRQLTLDEPTHPTTLNRHIDRDLATLCLKCLEKNPMHRYSSARVLAEDLERWVRHEPILARRAGPLMRTQRWVERNPVGAGLILTLLLGFGVSLWFLDQLARAKRKEEVAKSELKSANEQSDLWLRSLIENKRKDLEEFWANAGKRTMRISSEDLSLIWTGPGVATIKGADVLRLTVGIALNESPVSDSQKYYALLSMLEGAMTQRLRRTVRLDLLFYKFMEEKNRALSEGTLHITLMGVYPFLGLQAQGRHLQPLVIAAGLPRMAVLFTRTNSGIRTLFDVRGRSVAFGDTNSTTSFLCQVKLAEAGITGTDLSRYDYLDSTLEFIDDVVSKGADEAIRRMGHLHSHALVIEGVEKGDYDLGVAQERAFILSHGRGLVQVGQPFEVTRRIWVASERLEKEVVEAFIGSMTGFTDRKLLQSQVDAPEFFTRIPESTFEDQRKWISRMSSLFPVRNRQTPGATPSASPGRQP